MDCRAAGPWTLLAGRPRSDDQQVIPNVSPFTAPGDPDRELLGGKGAELAQMVQLGLPVPPGFTVTTRACRHVLEHGEVPPTLRREVDRALADIEVRLGRRFGDDDDPLLLAVRSGAAVSMPGMMDTVLDIGLTDRSVEGLARSTGDERFALDCYRRLIQMFGETVFGVAPARFAAVLDDVVARSGVDRDVDLDAAALRLVVQRNKDVCAEDAGRTLPQDPREQLELAIEAVFGSWRSERAALYRRRFGIDDRAGTAVNVQVMVYGNRSDRSGSGVAFTRDPATGDLGDYGEFLRSAQGEDVVSGVRTALPLDHLRELDPASYRRLRSIMGTLERHYRDLCDIEFTIEEGRLWILQTRIGQRSPAAAFQIAADLLDAGWITEDEALLRVTGEQLTQLLFPRFDDGSAGSQVAAGLGTSPGAAVGRVVLDSATAVALAERGEDVILVREETRPEDLPGMLAARGILTGRGGRTSHAAVVARGLGLPAVCGVEGLEVDAASRQVTIGGRRVLAEGDVISVDGGSGRVFRGRQRTVTADVVRRLEGEAVQSPVADAVVRLLAHADRVRGLGVRANADTVDDVARALRFGADGVGLCRTEHMFLGERRTHVERVILGDDVERSHALVQIGRHQREELAGILDAADGRSVTVRLLDAPLHEFLPDLTDLSVRVALELSRSDGHRARVEADRRRLGEVKRLHEENPMTGLRGVRLSILHPELVTVQSTAAFEALADHRERGGRSTLELMVPLVSTVEELETVARAVRSAAEQVGARRGPVQFRLGTMVETPRAALTADRLAGVADFLSFGTNDLTQLTWGLSRDDADRSFLPRYVEDGIIRSSPFDTIDQDGVGVLVRDAVHRARSVRADLPIGLCGEHGGEPASIRFLGDIGIDYVSCSSFRIPVARLEAGRTAVLRLQEQQRPGGQPEPSESQEPSGPLARLATAAGR